MGRNIKILVVAGEASGDRLAGRALIHAKEIAEAQDNTLDHYGIGGREGQAAGMKCLYSNDECYVVGY